MNIKSSASRLVLIAAFATTPVVPTAMAQDADDNANTKRLGTVNITAQRREQNLQDVPIAVSAFDAEDLEIVQVNDTVDLVDTIPNLIGGNNTALGTATSYTLRGQGQDESFATFDPAVGTYIDEVFVARQNASNVSLFDVERLEVLRGPQGTLFGKNTTGGAVNIIMRKPDDVFGGYVEAGFGRFDRTTVRASVDLPLSETVRSKFSFFNINDDGWLKNSRTGGDFNDKQATGIRGALSMDLNDDITWDLSANYIEDAQTNITGALIGDDVVSTSILSGGLAVVFPGATVNQKADFGNKTEAVNLVSNLEWRTNAGTLNFIVGNRDLEQNFLANFPLPNFGAFFPSSPDDVFIIDNVGQHDQFSAELKWTADYLDDRLNLVTGLYYLDEDNVTDFANYFASATPGADRVFSNTAENISAYAQGDYALTDNLTATVGVRYTDEEKNFTVVDNLPLAGGAGGTLASGGNQTDLTNANVDELGIPRAISESVFTPRFALQYDFSDDVMAFVSATRGFRTGGWSARSNTAAGLQPFQSEFVWSYEAGTRAVINDIWTVNATAFLMEVDDLQINTSLGGGSFGIGNAGKMENVGLEIETFLTPIDGLNLFAFLGIQDAEYQPDQAELDGCAAILAGGGTNSRFGALAPDCSIADVKRTPDWTINIGGSYDIVIPGGGILQPRASLRAVPDHITTSINRGSSGDYTLYNLGVEYTAPSNAWSVTLECTNCGEERYLASTFGSGDIYYNQPGRWEARLNYKFGGAR